MGLRLPAASASGQTRWERQQPLPEAQWGQEHGQGSGQGLGTTFPRCWEPRLEDQTHSPRLVQKRLCFSLSVAWKGYTSHTILTIEMA